ncbi:MAG: hypothetical protein CO042_02675 [Parcubacteria group bacterium CG_4_9_14_0_2_um_filter_41_8]|nr:MAG: hypothetical protein COW93_02045 [Parcubacteria group bacterium CG22_combo_CG10-13_8_21_14_all_41_9]PJC40647.1 MAG: hypothetical protein CO042_02675 [Parcubacteria group bacterium CG_4_9_14_0_2_um_filter_41_8]
MPGPLISADRFYLYRAPPTATWQPVGHRVFDALVRESLAKAGEILGIEVLDYIIIADSRFCSLKEKGFF